MATPCSTCPRARLLGTVPDLVRTHRDALVRVARAEGLHGEDALDVVQEAFGALLARGEAPAENVGRTLAAYTRNFARNRRRLHSRARPHDGALEQVPSADVGAEARLLAAEEHARLDRCVARLADVQRAVVTLRMLEDRSGAEVAERLGLTPGHVAVLLHRARGALAHCLSEEA